MKRSENFTIHPSHCHKFIMKQYITHTHWGKSKFCPFFAFRSSVNVPKSTSRLTGRLRWLWLRAVVVTITTVASLSTWVPFKRGLKTLFTWKHQICKEQAWVPVAEIALIEMLSNQKPTTKTSVFFVHRNTERLHHGKVLNRCFFGRGFKATTQKAAFSTH